MEINKKKWIIIGGTLSTFALAPLAAATGPSVFNPTWAKLVRTLVDSGERLADVVG